MRWTLLLFLLALICACATTIHRDIATDASPATPTACAVDADCTVKNVGNCCGYYPQCVSVAHRPNPVAVQTACEREGRSSVCGFSEIAGCRCVDGQCVSAPVNSSLQ